MNRKTQIEVGVLAASLLAAGTIWYFHKRPVVASGGSATSVVANYKPMGVENPQIRWGELERARSTEYKTTGRDIFSRELPPPPVAPLRVAKPGDKDYVPPPPPPDPPPPSLPLKFFGYGTVPVGSGRRAFLTDGDEVYIVAEGDTLLGRFRVVKINNVNLEFEEISSGRRGSAVLEEQGPSV